MGLKVAQLSVTKVAEFCDELPIPVTGCGMALRLQKRTDKHICFSRIAGIDVCLCASLVAGLFVSMEES